MYQQDGRYAYVDGQGQQQPQYQQPANVYVAQPIQQQWGQQQPAYYQPQPPAYQTGYAQPIPYQAQPQYQPTKTAHTGTIREPLSPLSPGGVPIPQNEDLTKFSNNGCRDSFWAVLFIVHLIALIGLSIYMYVTYGDNIDDNNNSSGNNNNNDSDSVQLNSDTWGLIGIFFAIAFVFAACWLQFIKKNATCLVWTSLAFSVILNIGMAVLFFAAQEVAGGVIMIILALINILWIYLVRNRIQFAANMLEVVSGVIQLYPATTYVAYVSIIFQAVWLIIWVLGASSTIYAMRNSNMSNGLQNFIYFLLLISVFWTSQVIKNIVHVTVAGTTATWYFLYPDRMPTDPTVKALKRASWNSLGSIALGSLIIAVIKAVRTLVQQARNTNHEIVRCIVVCLLNCLDSLVEYFNIYAFTQVAIYGKTYIQAASDTWQLFKTTGFTAIINDDLTGSVLFFSSFIGGVICAIVGGILAYWAFDEPMWAMWALIGFIVGLLIVTTAMEVLHSAVVCLFVCYVEDPAALQASKPAIYDMLTFNIRDNTTKGSAFLQQRNARRNP